VLVGDVDRRQHMDDPDCVRDAVALHAIGEQLLAHQRVERLVEKCNEVEPVGVDAAVGVVGVRAVTLLTNSLQGRAPKAERPLLDTQPHKKLSGERDTESVGRHPSVA
jgi:hypothetical protein